MPRPRILIYAAAGGWQEVLATTIARQAVESGWSAVLLLIGHPDPLVGFAAPEHVQVLPIEANEGPAQLRRLYADGGLTTALVIERPEVTAGWADAFLVLRARLRSTAPQLVFVLDVDGPALYDPAFLLVVDVPVILGEWGRGMMPPSVPPDVRARAVSIAPTLPSGVEVHHYSSEAERTQARLHLVGALKDRTIVAATSGADGHATWQSVQLARRLPRSFVVALPAVDRRAPAMIASAGAVPGRDVVLVPEYQVRGLYAVADVGVDLSGRCAWPHHLLLCRQHGLPTCATEIPPLIDFADVTVPTTTSIWVDAQSRGGPYDLVDLDRAVDRLTEVVCLTRPASATASPSQGSWLPLLNGRRPS